jgi:hypothetical protein
MKKAIPQALQSLHMPAARARAAWKGHMFKAADFTRHSRRRFPRFTFSMGEGSLTKERKQRLFISLAGERQPPDLLIPFHCFYSQSNENAVRECSVISPARKLRLEQSDMGSPVPKA